MTIPLKSQAAPSEKGDPRSRNERSPPGEGRGRKGPETLLLTFNFSNNGPNRNIKVCSSSTSDGALLQNDFRGVGEMTIVQFGYCRSLLLIENDPNSVKV